MSSVIPGTPERIEGPGRNHSPDSPFGCTVAWGERLVAIPDGRVHICNRASDHRGKHACKCGDPS